MKRILLLLLAALAMAGCSHYGRLLKSKNPAEQYAGAKKYIEEKKYEKARTLFDKVRLHYMDKPQADSILFYQALTFYAQKEYGQSAEGFDMFRTEYPRSALLEQAEYLYAMGHYNASPEAVRDQSTTVQAIDAINTYISRYPGSPKRGELEEKREELIHKLHEKAYLNARTYYKIGQYHPAVAALSNALKEYPDSSYREELLYLSALSAYEYAANSVPAARRTRYLDMMERHINYISEYPDGKHAAELTKLYEKAREYVNENE
jgi:outer membrane protein assembly factor BamD